MLLELVVLLVIGVAIYIKRDYVRAQLKRILSSPDKDISYLIEESKSTMKSQFDRLYELKAINACLEEDLSKLNEASEEHITTKARIADQQKIIDKNENILKNARKQLADFEAKQSGLRLRQGVLDMRTQLFNFSSSLNTDGLASKIGDFEQNLRVHEKKIELMETDNL